METNNNLYSMNKNINLCEILKNCSEGTKFWHSIHGEVTLVSIDNDLAPIKLKICTGGICYLAKDGHQKEGVGDCLLWPSKYQRDWCRFSLAKAEKFDIRSLKPFDKVLVRDYDEKNWLCDFYSYYSNDYKYPFKTVLAYYKQCVPYNDYTKHLIGTNQTPPDFYDKCWELY